MDLSATPILISRRGFLLAGAAGAGVLTLGTAGCAFDQGDPAGGSSIDSTQEVLKLATGFAIENLIPLKTGFWGNEFGYAELLLRPRPDGNPTDWLLEKVENEGDLIWKLNLKPGVTFQNGNPLTAEKLATLMTWHLANNDSVKPLFPEATIEASGDNELTFTTSVPTPQMRNVLADEAYFTIFDLDAYLETADDAEKLLAARIYTGPYTPVSLTDEKLVMEVNPNYWDGTPGLGGVEVLFVADAGARVKAVQNGEVDLALYPPTQSSQTLANDDRASFNLGNAAGPTFCLYLNQEKAVFAEAKVRRAILRMIDYRALAEDVMQGFYETVASFYDPALAYAIDIWKTDVAEAEKLLGEAGAQKADGVWKLASGEPITFEVLTYPQQPDSDALALAVQSQLHEQGIEMAIRQVPDITAEQQAGTWDAAISANGTLSFGGSPIPPLQRGYRSDGKRNYSHINDPELDRLIDEVAVTIDQEKAKELLISIQEIIGEQGYNGYLGRRRPGVVVGQRMPDYLPQHALLWVDAKTVIGA